jgi:hypothetical protein
LFLGEPRSDHELAGKRLNHSRFLGLAALMEMPVQLIEVRNPRDRSRESALHGLDRTLGVRFLVASSWHAKPGIERIVFCQRVISGMDLVFASWIDQK